MRTTNLDNLLSEFDILPNYVDDPSRSMRLAFAFLAVLLLVLMFLLPPISKGKSGSFLSSTPVSAASEAPPPGAGASGGLT